MIFVFSLNGKSNQISIPMYKHVIETVYKGRKKPEREDELAHDKGTTWKSHLNCKHWRNLDNLVTEQLQIGILFLSNRMNSMRCFLTNQIHEFIGIRTLSRMPGLYTSSVVEIVDRFLQAREG